MRLVCASTPSRHCHTLHLQTAGGSVDSRSDSTMAQAGHHQEGATPSIPLLKSSLRTNRPLIIDATNAKLSTPLCGGHPHGIPEGPSGNHINPQRIQCKEWSYLVQKSSPHMEGCCSTAKSRSSTTHISMAGNLTFSLPRQHSCTKRRYCCHKVQISDQSQAATGHSSYSSR